MKLLFSWLRRSAGAFEPPAGASDGSTPGAPGGLRRDRRPELEVATAPELAVLGPGLEFTSRGRFRCGADPERADVLLVAPASAETLRELRARLDPAVDVVVVDRRGSCSAELVAAMLDAGATTVVTGASSAVLTAHLDAVARRKRSRARRRTLAHS
ncbi:MAG TPA: hypothetical protein VIL48_09715 [Acidimicrobiales bacterium]